MPTISQRTRGPGGSHHLLHEPHILKPSHASRGHNHRTPAFIASAVPGCSQVGLADGASAPSTAKSSCNTVQLGPMPLFGRQKADGGKPRVDLHINIPEDAQLDDGTSRHLTFT